MSSTLNDGLFFTLLLGVVGLGVLLLFVPDFGLMTLVLFLLENPHILVLLGLAWILVMGVGGDMEEEDDEEEYPLP